MRLRGKLLEDVTLVDIQALKDNQVPESSILDYKLQLDLSDSGKRELLRDVAAMANAHGGVLLYGVREARDESNEPTGVPESVEGIQGENESPVRERVEQVIRAGLDPEL